MTSYPIKRAASQQGPSRRHKAFTLIELLVVMSIMILIASFVVPNLPAMLGAQGVSKAVADAGGILELARTEAMSRKTYVYVGFIDGTNAFGNRQLLIGAVASQDGMPIDPATARTTGTGNLGAITKLVAVENVQLMKTPEDFPANLRSGKNPLPTAAFDYLISSVSGGKFNQAAATNTSASFRLGGKDFTNAPQLVFSPQGELIGAASPLDPGSSEYLPYALLGMRPSHGTQANNSSANWAVLLLHGGTGIVQTLRP